MKSFRIGGIHPKENKFSAGAAIQQADIPATVAIPLSHYIGNPSEAIVKRGDTVKVGQQIGAANGFISANVHASVSGKVRKIDVQLDATGYRRPAVFVEVEGDEWLETIDRTPDIVRGCSLGKEEIIQKIKDAGIVGLGGATFPAHVKLMPPPGKKAEYLIINGVECEPYLTCDHRLMMEHGEEILIGTTILMKALGVDKAIVGIENNKPDAIEHMTRLATTFLGITIQPLKVQYPQGGEKQLIDAVLRRQVPSGKIPVEIGAVVFNVATTFAVYEAVQKNKPMIDRVMTITGKDFPNPSNYRVRLGTYLSHVVEQAGGIPEGTGKIVGGGPMMGRSLMNLDVPMAKGSAGVLFMRDDESIRKPSQNCIRCAKCVSTCPMGLEPYLLMAYCERNMWDELESNRTMDCIECGSCNYTCPSHRPLSDYIRFGKSTVGNIIRNRNNK
ncbi:MAG: electron transport complex subunit RsxC [Paludibacter sp.]|jgi:electron transport complex protein RnfC|nr:electron transport complex subunit RsxC [Paludibacter sp.]HOS46333.1 electron transport complex subunit RsxC [Paludibacter sp.]HPM10905.1 electron transport complex subunit RsxC [Paludibacter sp.]